MRLVRFDRKPLSQAASPERAPSPPQHPKCHMSKSLLHFNFKCHLLCDANPTLRPSALDPQRLRTCIMRSPYGLVLFLSVPCGFYCTKFFQGLLCTLRIRWKLLSLLPDLALTPSPTSSATTPSHSDLAIPQLVPASGPLPMLPLPNVTFSVRPSPILYLQHSHPPQPSHHSPVLFFLLYVPS